MSISVKIPAPLQKMTNEQSDVTCQGSTIKEIIDNLDYQYAGIKDRIVDEKTGKIRRFINMYLNDEDIRFMQGEDTPVKDGDEVSIIPAMAGGRG